METEKPPELIVCTWCRMGLHHKCDMKLKVTGVCMCLCDRGF